MHSPSGMRQEYARRMLDFFLNSGFTPATDYSVVLGGHPFLGNVEGSYPKAAASDFDGIFEKKGAEPLYKTVMKKICKENREVGRRNNEVLAFLSHLRTPEDVPAVEAGIGGVYTECGLTSQQYMDANNEAAKEFITHDLVKGARSYVRRLDEEMGYPLSIVSAGYDLSLYAVCDYLHIPAERVYATTVGFYGRTVRPRLMLGVRKREAKSDVVERMVGTRNGCCIVIDDNPSKIEAPFIKSGLNPSIIVGDFKRHELPFDVTVPCPEAREDLTKLIPPMYRYEYGWVATRTTDAVTEQEIINAASEITRSLADAQSICDERARFRLASRANRLLGLKEQRGLVRNVDMARSMLTRFLISEGEDRKNLADELLEYFHSYVPETRAQASMLEDLL